MRLASVWVFIFVFRFTQATYAQAVAPDQINPPFGLHWGENQKEISAAIQHAGAKIAQKHNVSGREAWTIEGLVQPALKRAILYFGTEKTLVEVELQYQDPSWDLVAYEEFLKIARDRLQARYGPPTVLARDKRPEGDVMQTVVGFQWQQLASSIQLFFYSAERKSDAYRSVSLHYRAG